MVDVRLDIEKGKASGPFEGFVPNPKLKLLDQISEVVGHARVLTTQIYTHVMARPGLGIRSPVDLPG